MIPDELGAWIAIAVAIMAITAMLSFAVVFIVLTARLARKIWQDEIKG
jgi:hypothetical protein